MVRPSRPGAAMPLPLPNQVYRHADGYNVRVESVTLTEGAEPSILLVGYENTNPRVLSRFADQIRLRSGEWVARFTFVAENVSRGQFFAEYR